MTGETPAGTPQSVESAEIVPLTGEARMLATALEENARLRAEHDALAAAVDRVRRRHPRGDEESSSLAPGLWCPTCGHERSDNGYGGCPDRRALIIPGLPLRTRPGRTTEGGASDGA